MLGGRGMWNNSSWVGKEYNILRRNYYLKILTIYFFYKGRIDMQIREVFSYYFLNHINVYEKFLI